MGCKRNYGGAGRNNPFDIQIGLKEVVEGPNLLTVDESN